MAASSSHVSLLIWEGNSTGAVLAQKRISEQNKLTTEQVVTGNRRQKDSFGAVGKASEGLRGSIRNLAGLAGLGGLFFGFKDVVQGGIELQKNQALLRQSLGSSQSSFQGLNDAAEKLSTSGGFATPQNLQALANFERETHNSAQSLSMLSLATNIARARNIDLGSAVQVVAQAYTGNVGRLQKLLGPMEAAKGATFGLTQAHAAQIAQLDAEAKSAGKGSAAWLAYQKQIAALTPQQRALAALQDKQTTATHTLALAQQTFGGSTLAYSKTTSGGLSNVSNSVHNLVDNLGVGLLPIVSRVSNAVAGWVGWLDKNRKVLDVLVGVVGGVTGTVLAYKGVVAGVAGAQKAWTLATKIWVGLQWGYSAAMAVMSLATDGFAAALGALATAEGFATLGLTVVVGALVMSLAHWNTTKKVVSDLAHVIMNGLGAAFHWLEGAAGTLERVLVRPFQDVYNTVMRLTHVHLPGFLGSIGHILGFEGGGVVPAWGKSHTVMHFGPASTDTVPAMLSPGEGVLNTRAMSRLGPSGLAAMNSGAGGGGGTLTIQPGVVNLRMDSRLVAQGVVEYTLRRGARGPSSYSGGSLATGNLTGIVDAAGGTAQGAGQTQGF